MTSQAQFEAGFRVLAVLPLLVVLYCFDISAADDRVDFDRDVRPILKLHCFRCHGPAKQEGGLRLDQKRTAFRGGDNYGPAIRIADGIDSPLFQFVSREDADLKMPPMGARLTPAEIEILLRWILQGAIWPDDANEGVDPALKHWSFQPPQRSRPPSESSITIQPIDSFIAAELTKRGLTLSGPASRPVLIRRAYFDLIGLPPTYAEVEEFVHDPDAHAYDRLIDRLLASPHFGERWARHWLDVIRFAESHGFEMNQPRSNAWQFRDYVIRAMNDDLPYDQFVRQQLAGDQFDADEGTGFLVAGPWDQVKSPDPVLTAQQRADELHDMVSTTASTFLGLTVGCARCHTHKFDPIPQTDYYALKACLEGVQHGEREVLGAPKSDPAQVEKIRAELADFESQPGPTPINPRLNVERIQPTAARKVRFTVKATNQLEPCIDELEVWTGGPTPRNVALAINGAKASASSTYPHSDIHRLEHIHDGRYGNGRSWISREPGGGWIEIEFAERETIERILWGRDREQKYTDRLPTEYIIETSDVGDWKTVASSRDHAESADRIQKRKDLEQRLAAAQNPPRIYAGKFASPPVTMRLHRGDPLQPREAIAPASLTHLGRHFELPPEASDAARRRALADWIADQRNPLTARVIVNRLWQQHFGEGLVGTPSDLGRNGATPSHPELLDWLADELIQSGWSLKHIHRIIVLSAAYRQSSSIRPDAMAVDAANRLLWRFASRRLEAEAVRDAILVTCGNLDRRMGGPGFDLFEPNNNYVKVYQPRQEFGPAEWRRMVYQSKPRMQLDDIFGAFDCPDAGQIAPKRTRSITALQALNLLNSTFIVQQSQYFAQRLSAEAGSNLDRQVELAFECAFQRLPSAQELQAAKIIVQQEGLTILCRALLNANEFLFVF